MYSLESYALKFDFKFRDLKYECVEVIKGKFSGELSLDNENLSVNSVRIDGNEAKFSIADKRLILGPVEGKEITIEFAGNISETSLMGIHDVKYENGHIMAPQFSIAPAPN